MYRISDRNCNIINIYFNIIIKKMKIIIKYNDDHIKIKFLNNINYKIKSDLSKICDLVTLEYKREQNEIEELIENCNNIIEQIKDEKKKLKKWWKIKKIK